ncbi:MAG: M23 family metallopeptidase [Candidatus Zixiibacteriota bacterium]
MRSSSTKKRKILRIVSFLILIAILFLLRGWLDLFEKKNVKVEQAGINPLPLACIFQGEIAKNEPLYLSLLKKGISSQLAYDLTSALKGKLDLRKSLPGDCYTLVSTSDSILLFEYQKGLDQRCRVTRERGELKATIEPLQFNCIIRSIQGEIGSSLWESMIDECKNPELILKFAEVFEWEIDFLTEPQRGDSFRLIFEEYAMDGNFVKYGDILAAEYRSGKQTTQAVLYQIPGGRKDWYEPSGKSVRKAFLKSPLNYRRISSRFSYGRFHPILKRYRPHLGVDYAAPTGTPIVSSADGVVISAGWKGGLGKAVEIRHANGFVTSYGHLSGIARGIRSGARVKQKDLIGYVGSTGLATGPHLDYRVKVNGRFVNPLKMVSPPVEPVKPEYLADFKAQRDNLLYALNLLTQKTLLAQANGN